MIKCPSQPTPPAARGSAAARKPGRAGWAPHSSGSSPAAAGRLSQLTAATLGTDAYSYSEDKAPDGRKGDWTNEQHLPRRGEGAMGCARVNIGNRKTAQEAAEEATAYDVNNLNQYTAIQEGTAEAFVPTFDADGKAPDGCKGDWTNARHLPEGRGAEGRLRVNQTKVKTSTGIWNVVYNAENRPVTFTSEDGATVVECTYDYVGRRHTRKITVNGSVTNYLRYIYRGYLQIAAINAVSGVFQWFILWDPTQPVATRPLGIRKDGTWYTYGWDLTKNICEVFGSDGYIKTAYTYTPYGAVTANGNVTQPIQWSSEVRDGELGLVYYNYRYYNPLFSNWVRRDPMKNPNSWNTYAFVGNNSIVKNDFLGLDSIGVIYYVNAETDKARSFQRAALRWLNHTGSQTSQKLSYPVTTKSEFINAWNAIAEASKAPGACVSKMAIFSHARKYENSKLKPSLEFVPDQGERDGGVYPEDIANLSKITWCSCAELILKGCRSGLPAPTIRYSLADAFAYLHDVITWGERGYAYFSEVEDKYDRIDDLWTESEDIFLNAYDRSGNRTLEIGERPQNRGDRIPPAMSDPIRFQGVEADVPRDLRNLKKQ